jgi:TetR/AcrR family transcriptional repressor of mexJK operon
VATEALFRVPGGDGLAGRREARRQAFLQAAGDLFCEKGYGATNLADVVRRSGGSLSTLYEFFGNKAGLFKALIAERVLHITGMFDTDGALERPPEQALAEFAQKMLDLVLDREVIAVQRLVIAESPRFPELAGAFFSAGPAAVARRLETYLANQHTKGRLRIADPALAAEHFAGVVKGSLHTRTLFGVGQPLPDAEARAHRISCAVALFLRAYAPDTDGAY